ncbi:homer protein homolog 1-like isoform X3 [Petromyzon marinus]|uniref:homer protein homolog 1-like isoform X3 n=1 Tax=Petromyzon marinus TaxID=7757 RepID=UPI003F6F1AC4
MGTQATVIREQPVFTTRAHVFQIDPATKKAWMPVSKQAIVVAYYHHAARNSFRIVAVEGPRVVVNSAVAPGMSFTKTSHKFGQWVDGRANTVYGLGFGSEQLLEQFADKFEEVKAAMLRTKYKPHSSPDIAIAAAQGLRRGQSRRSARPPAPDETFGALPGQVALPENESTGRRPPPHSSLVNGQELEAELAALRGVNAELKASLETADSATEASMRETATCRQECEALLAKVNELERRRAEADRLLASNAQLSRHAQELEFQISEREQERALLTQRHEEVKEMKEEAERNLQKIKETEQKNAELQKRASALKEELSERQRKKEAAGREIDGWLRTLDGNIAELVEFRDCLAKIGQL